MKIKLIFLTTISQVFNSLMKVNEEVEEAISGRLTRKSSIKRLAPINRRSQIDAGGFWRSSFNKRRVSNKRRSLLDAGGV